MVQEGEDSEFVQDDPLDLAEIPQIPLPFRDDLSDNLKDLIRAILINQQNIISNCSFLYKRLQEISVVLKRLSPPDSPHTAGDVPQIDPEPPTELPSLYSVPEE